MNRQTPVKTLPYVFAGDNKYEIFHIVPITTPGSRVGDGADPRGPGKSRSIKRSNTTFTSNFFIQI